jgi:hypothetical protein
MLIGLLSVPAYAFQASGSDGFLTLVSVGVLLAGASLLVGGTLGFLFGIPRTLQQESGAADANGTKGEAPSGARTIDYRVNTNLEQISDWLTKILVGVSLTQVGNIRQGLGALSAFAARGLGSGPHAQVFAFALLSYSTVLGFLFGYLWTRLFLAGALRQADRVAIGALVEKVESTERKVDALKKQSELDAEALGLAYRHLNPSADLPEVTQEALDKAIAPASKPIKVQLFHQASQTRTENWRDLTTKPKVERTIAIFRSLIRNDVENRFHRNHGQLGYALKDKPAPEWAEAEKELTIAIQLRGSWREHGWVFYEFNRGICRIMIDPDFSADRPSDPDRKSQILEDLRVAAQGKGIMRIISEEPAIRKWLALNGLTEKDLRGPVS